MAAEHVEARSLTALNALAANPPQYPVKPNEARQDPLTLYISRVPGTRDIILSTARPQLKNVSVTDVSNSLYYVHFNTPEDEQLASAAAPEAPAGEPRKSMDSLSSTNMIPRKPVRGAQDPSQLHNSTEAPHSGQSEANGSANPGGERHPHFQEPLPGSTPNGPGDQAPMQRNRPGSILRKPVQSQPQKPIPEAGDDHPPPPPPHMSLPPRPDEIDSLPIEYQDWRPDLPPRPSAPGHPGFDSFAGLAPSPPSTSRSPSPGNRKPFTPFSLTIIRRDPSTGQQWNIGQVASFQLEHPEMFLEEKHTPSPSINIHLEAAGYNKFRGMPMSLANFDIEAFRGSLDVTRPTSGSSRLMPTATNHTTSAVSHTTDTLAAPKSTYNGFERQVKMMYAPSWTSNIRNAFRRLDSKDGDLSTSPNKKIGHSRDTSTASAASMGSFDGDFDGGEAPIITMPGPGLKPRGYMFMSPWDGRCEFRTGAGGRSVQCRHILPGTGGAYNPLVNGGGAGDDGPLSPGGGRSRKGSAARSNIQAISELRFNLPSSELFNGSKSPSPEQQQHHQQGQHLHEGRERMRDRIINGMTNKTEDDLDDYEYEVGGYDMTLGKEKAGGGNRGKRAKMGKLIVCEDGLKMLDLVVAANVGIWWCVWERKND
ncbi:oxidoreductase-like protein [Apiospora marii]|uniref:Oxidoreductase-like protein n=1 Tax=Apiospora marii TaxID=335849 RepID=A0ABR1T118_9PEZI